MASEKKMKIAFKHGGIIPASVIGAKDGKDRRCGAHQPFSVPESYGNHLVSDGFAYEVKPAAQEKKEAKALADANKAVADAEAKVAAAGEDAAKKAAAEKELADARAALAELQD